MTPKEAEELCERTIDPAGGYALNEVAKLLGMHPLHIQRHYVPRHLPPIPGTGRSEGGRGRRYRGSDVLALAQWRAAQVQPHSGVIAMAQSNNAKLGGAAVTIVARQSCPDSCPFRGEGCYAEHDNNRRHWDRISWGAADKSPLDLARAEAAAIDELPGARDLRLHVAGDSVTVVGTRLIAAACARYVERGRARGRSVAVWAYTHGWRTVPRAAWGVVSVLASCETADDVRLARSRGYAAAVVVSRFEKEKAHEQGGVRILPCPQQTRGRSCTDCRLCFADGRLRGANLAIGFALHGGGTNKARRVLTRVSLPLAA